MHHFVHSQAQAAFLHPKAYEGEIAHRRGLIWQKSTGESQGKFGYAVDLAVE